MKAGTLNCIHHFIPIVFQFQTNTNRNKDYSEHKKEDEDLTAAGIHL